MNAGVGHKGSKPHQGVKATCKSGKLNLQIVASVPVSTVGDPLFESWLKVLTKSNIKP